MVSKVVRVRAGYRLHLGFYRFYDHPYIYGSIGISVEEPYINVVVSESPDLKVICSTKLCEDIVSNVVKLLKVRDVEVMVNGFLRHNVGLGSKTRITLATYLALKTYLNLSFDMSDITKLLGRKISGVGVYSFLYGNLVVDSGLDINDKDLTLPKLVGVYEVPSNWYLIIALPEGVKGLSEFEEGPILSNVGEFPKQELLYKEYVKLITALTLKDFNTFTQSLTNIQQLTGEYFSKFQGSIFTHEVSEEVVNIMKSEGVRGIGQSSWGPTTYGFIDNYVKALSVKSAITTYFEKKGLSIRCWVTNTARLGHQLFINLKT